MQALALRSGFKNTAIIVGAALLPHIPCIAIASGLMGTGAAMATLLSNPLLIAAGVFLSLSSISLTRYFVCRYRCGVESCAPLSDKLQVTVRTRSRAERKSDAAAKTAARRRAVGFHSTGYLAVAVASAFVVPRFLPHTHCHAGPMIGSIDYSKSVLLSCPNSSESMLVTLADGKINFVKGQDIGATRMDACGATVMWMPHMQPREGTSALTMGEAGEIFRKWGCCTVDKQMKAIDGSAVDSPLKDSFKQAVRSAWLGLSDNLVECQDPSLHTIHRQNGR